VNDPHQRSEIRLALIVELVERAPNHTLGRTAIVKMIYLLQVLRGVPLGYDFRLYTYGPFDSQVLSDLAYAQALKAVEERTILYTAGYGYEVRPGPAASAVKDHAANWLQEQGDSIEWVVGWLGGCKASELELLSTIVYVDRELATAGRSATVAELAKRVRHVKPHFAEDYVQAKVRWLSAKGVLGTM
jgi:hypothetical protein